MGTTSSTSLGDEKSQFVQAAKASTKEKRVLVIVSTATILELQNNETIETGYFLSELAPVLRELEANGFTVDLATPKGDQPTIDLHGLNLAFYAFPDLTNTLKAKENRFKDIETARHYFGLPKHNFELAWEDPTFRTEPKLSGDYLIKDFFGSQMVLKKSNSILCTS